jgi:uncharacterized protein with NRDE domain
MCVIVLAFQVNAELPLIIAANRDEYYARRSEPPMRLSESPRIVGGRDAERGGTWMGFTSRGFFVGLTNQRTIGPPEPTRRSRGEVVLGALRAGSVKAVEELLATTDAREYNPYNLVFGDGGALRVASARTGEPRVAVRALGPGLHVLANDTLGTTLPKVRRAEELSRPWLTKPWSELGPALERMLGDHEMPPLGETPEPPPWMDRALARSLQAICIHTPIYGTRSATVAAIGRARGDENAGHVEHYAFAAGAPHDTPFVDVRALLDDD